MVKFFLRQVNIQFRQIVNIGKYRKSRKVFCIGRNKTGTTSMATLFKEVGLPIGSQRVGELLVKDWSESNFKRIIWFVKYCGVAFQDIPFSLPNTFKILDKEFPNSKFILTVRDSPEIWYKSLTSFHAKLFGNGNIPDKSDLQKANYIYPGWMWKANRLVYDTPENDIYNESILKKHYTDYNASVIEYFKDKPKKLLVINLKEPNAAIKISHFLDSNKIVQEIPWENKT